MPDPAGAWIESFDDDREKFAVLQQRLSPLFRRVFPDRHANQTVVVVPSLSLDREELTKLTGASHYEERLLCMLMLLRLPRTHVVYVTSEPLAPAIVEYYLQLLPGIPVSHARRRLTLLSCHDASTDTLTAKILARPRLLERIRAAIADPWSAHMTCFNATPLERRLAVQLGIPLYACDPDLGDRGTKSGSREVFRRAGVPHPDGFERLRDLDDVANALVELKRRQPTLKRAVVKLEEGFSGEGNAVFAYDGAPDGAALSQWVRAELPTRLRYVAPDESWEHYRAKFALMGGIVECFVEGAVVRSPSVQCRVDPLGLPSVISTHDQLLGGASGQVYQGCVFPAAATYSVAIQDAAMRVADTLAQDGVLGRFGVDFVSVLRGSSWESQAIEINLRKGGTTHPFLMLQFLTDGTYDPETCTFRTPTGRACCYYASDNLGDPSYRGLTPDDLIDIAVNNDLHFDAASQQGVTFHLIGALSQYGKLGTVCIGATHADAERYFHRTVAVLDHEARR
ncbi:MAG: ATP-grasp domain-containing protein [Cytophagaceae bacterium]|nr:ATP-grasp domain-containing protein [Gemmatimonadaceae bacterium]